MQTPWRKNTILWVAALLLFVFLAGSLSLIFSISQQSEDQIAIHLQEATAQRASSLGRHLGGAFQVLRTIAIGLGREDLTDTEGLAAQMEAYNQSNSFTCMGLVGVKEAITSGCVLQELSYPKSPAGQRVFQQALLGEEVLSPTVEEPTLGGWVNYFLAPVYQQGSLAGALCATAPGETLLAALSAPVFQGTGDFAILDSDGVAVCLSPAMPLGASLYSLARLGEAEANSLVAALKTGQQHIFTFDREGVELLSVVTPLEVNGWSLVSLVPHQELKAYYHKTMLGTAIIMVVACFGFLALLRWQMRIMAESQKDLERLAYQDELTGLRSYDKLLLDVEALLVQRPRKSRYALWSFDIRQFHAINDIFGAAIGNEVLQLAAELLNRDENDETFACRIAADMFAGIRPYQNQEELDQWFEEGSRIFTESALLSDQKIKIYGSLGLYCVDELAEAIQVEEMVNRATIAKKEAKESAGTSLVYFTRGMGERIHRNAALEADSERALENGEFLVYFQPKVAIQGGLRVDGAEALVRWNHPEFGFISPGEFIPLFEKNSFIVELDRYIFDSACRWLVESQKKGCPPINLAVNISRQGFLREDFLAHYQAVKERYGIADGVLELEITESVIFENFRFLEDAVRSFQNAGFTCSIDDFGAGYSSLNVLKSLTIDMIKLDALFFQGAQDVERAYLMIEGFLAIARNLGIRTIAEGVETPEQVRFLKQAGCDMIQGYFFSKPLPAEEFEAYLLRNAEGIVL